MFSEGGLVPDEVVILTGGFDISEDGIMSAEVAGRRISGARYLLWRWCHPFVCETRYV